MRRLRQEAASRLTALRRRQAGEMAQQIVQQQAALPAPWIVDDQRTVGARCGGGLVGQRLRGCERRRRIGFARRRLGPPVRQRRLVGNRQLGLLGLDDMAFVRELEAVARPALVRQKRRKVEGLRHGAHAGRRVVGYRGLGAGAQAGLDPLVPAAAIGLAGARPAADIEPVLGARHGDVQQAVLLLQGAAVDLAAPAARRLVGVVGARQPEPGFVVGAGQQALAVLRYPRRVGQVDDRRLQALRGMHRQDAQLAPPVLVEVALDLAAPRLEPAQETLQRATLDPLVLQRARQQFVDRIGGLAAQPLHEPPPAALRAERAGEEIEGRVVVGALQPVGEGRVSRREGRRGRAFAQGAPQMAGPLPGQAEELVLVEPDQRRLQQGREIEIVLRQENEARHCQQILDGELLAEVEPVDTRDLDALALQRPHQRIHELVAPPHQHHEVAGM